MAVEIFLKLDNIDGESEKSGAEKWIEVFSFSNGASNHSTVSTGTGSGAGKVDISSISFSKTLDTASAKLFQSCCQGTHIPKGSMIVRESTGGTTTETYFQYDLTEVFVDSISWGGAHGGGKPQESLSLSAKSIVVTYWPQDEKGKLGNKQAFGWNLSKNAKV